MSKNILNIGETDFFIGCNYWASHAGTAMWSDWKPDIVEQDLYKLSKEGIQVLRVFPLWPDFQPIELLYGVNGQQMDYRFGEEHLPDDDAGRAGVSSVAMKRFGEFTNIAKKYNLKLIVGLITGWMSGRLFVPPALKGRDILTDKLSIMWQVRFVKYFVETFLENATIIAWDLGNECNCIQNVNSREEAWIWTSSISDAIKSKDSSRPLVSGMHSLSPKEKWTMQDQGELTDILTTHPYPFWIKHCNNDPINTIRPLLHATAESLFYSGIGQKPCFAEEMGTMGPMVSSEKFASDFLRASLLTLWSHGCHGVLWWCAHDQIKLNHAPYDWTACEGQLGLINDDGIPKPILKEMGRLRKVIEDMPFDRLPKRITEGVCIINTNQDHWGVAFSSFILAKQAGFDIDFQFEDQPLKDAMLYMVPNICGSSGIPKYRWKELLNKVSAGATLYVSMDDGYILEFEKVTGLSVNTRYSRSESTKLSLKGEHEGVELTLSGSIKLDVEATNAAVLGDESDGNILFSSVAYGEGKIYFLSMPLEMNFITHPKIFSSFEDEPYWKIYSTIFSGVNKNRMVKKNHPMVGVTEHSYNKDERVIVLINYSDKALSTTIQLNNNWHIDRVLYGNKPNNKKGELEIDFEPNDAVILKIVTDESIKY